MRIAIDVTVGRIRANALKALGYKIVTVARHSETDKSWVNRAFAEGAFFVISPDMDIPKIIEREGYPMCWVEYPNDNPEVKNDLVGYLDKVMKRKLEVFKTVTQMPKEAPCSGSYSSSTKSNTSSLIILSKENTCSASSSHTPTIFSRFWRMLVSMLPLRSLSPTPSVTQPVKPSRSRSSTR